MGKLDPRPSFVALGHTGFSQDRNSTLNDDRLQAFLDFVLAQYVSEGVGELDQAKLPHLLALKHQAVGDAADELGGVPRIRDAFIGFQRHLYGA